MGKVSIFSPVRKKGLSTRMNMETMMPTSSIKTRNDVPQRGWKRFCARTFSTVKGRPFS